VLQASRIPFSFFIMVLRKDELEVQLKDEHQLIRDGVLRDDSPLDLSDEFEKLCDACRKGDLKACQESITTGVNINARDQFDYTPLILVRFF
jgi:ankyrin repeat/BTB/POZ domain-containing protein 1